MTEIENRIEGFLDKRKNENLYRSLSIKTPRIDFSSNDYLGFSRSAFLHQKVLIDLDHLKTHRSGATGSRLLNGNSVLIEEVESIIAEAHHSEAALFFNSGFDANVGLISTVIRKNDTIFYDELVHASIHQGMKLSGATCISYAHNDLTDLQNKLESSASAEKFIITESLFSMDGDSPDLKKLAAITEKFGAHLIVDEAHATGIFGERGSGLCNEAGIEKSCFARVYTYGKAFGSHGGAVLCSLQVKDYLVNFSKNFIYSTAPETYNLLRVKHTYSYSQHDINQRNKLSKLNLIFKHELDVHNEQYKITGNGPVFSVLIGSSEKCKAFANHLRENDLDVRAIVSPTVKPGTERLRISIHSFNTISQIEKLVDLITTCS